MHVKGRVKHPNQINFFLMNSVIKTMPFAKTLDVAEYCFIYICGTLISAIIYINLLIILKIIVRNRGRFYRDLKVMNERS